jgi:WD40 repeat protein
LGHIDGKVTIYDFSLSTIVSSLSSDISSGCIQSLSMLNNCLHFLVGLSNGAIQLYELKTLTLQNTVAAAHLTKYEEGVNCIMAI